MIECFAAIRHDHSDIRTMLAVLERTVSRIACGEHVDADMIAGVTRFFEEFVAGCHERKEDQLLFPALAPLCSVRERQRLWNFQKQHVHGRRLLRKLVRVLRDFGGALDQTTSLRTATAEYAAHVRPQLQDEERWFGEVLPRLAPHLDEKLYAAFGRLQCERIGPTGREWYNQLVADYRDIVSTWSPPP